MSGYNSKTGRFELTSTKAHYWSRLSGKSMEFFAGVLRGGGLEVVAVHDAWLEVVASQDEIFRALRSSRSG